MTLRCVVVLLLCAAGCDGVLEGPIRFEEDPLLDGRRQYNLQRLNQIRGARGLPPLVMDDCLNQVAQRSTDAWIQSGELHGVFSRECLAALAGSCQCNWAQENQGWAQDEEGWQVEIDTVLQIMLAEGPGGGHHDNIVSPQWQRVGIGIRVYGGALHLTNDFGP